MACGVSRSASGLSTQWRSNSASSCRSAPWWACGLICNFVAKPSAQNCGGCAGARTSSRRTCRRLWRWFTQASAGLIACGGTRMRRRWLPRARSMAPRHARWAAGTSTSSATKGRASSCRPNSSASCARNCWNCGGTLEPGRWRTACSSSCSACSPVRCWCSWAMASSAAACRLCWRASSSTRAGAACAWCSASVAAQSCCGQASCNWRASVWYCCAWAWRSAISACCAASSRRRSSMLAPPARR